MSAYDAAGNISEALSTSVTTATPVTEPEPVEPPDTTTPDPNPVTAQARPEEPASTSVALVADSAAREPILIAAARAV